MDSESLRALRGQPGVADGAVERGFELAMEPPDAAEWRAFLERTLLGLGALLLVAGVFFFFAYNWRALGHVAKFVLLEGLLAGLFAGAWNLRDKLAGQVCLAAASAQIGALLAVYGQVYQTGADSWVLFATWAGLALPWAIAARFAPLWLGWLFLANLALVLFFDATEIVGETGLLLALAAFNGTAWGVGARRDAALWLLGCTGVATLGYLTFGACYEVGDLRPGWLVATLVPALVIVAALYRGRPEGLFFLAAVCASAITLLTTAFIRVFIDLGEHPAFWLLACVVLLAQLAVAASWLRFEAKRR